MNQIEKCIISDRSLLTIAKMNAAVGQTEWCGVVLYYPNPLLGLVSIIDVIPQAVGDPTYTVVYGSDETVLPDWAENLECSQGFVHSHHVMGTSPSGTDMEQVKAGMQYSMAYLSLIVNHHGKYTCLFGISETDEIKKLKVEFEFNIKVPKYVKDDRVFEYKTAITMDSWDSWDYEDRSQLSIDFDFRNLIGDLDKKTKGRTSRGERKSNRYFYRQDVRLLYRNGY